jgi:hypothetical protein
MMYRGQSGDYLDQGYGQDDMPEPADRGPKAILVNCVRPELCADGEMHECRTYREFPEFMAHAAFRWLHYWRRQFGKDNAWIEYDRRRNDTMIKVEVLRQEGSDWDLIGHYEDMERARQAAHRVVAERFKSDDRITWIHEEDRIAVAPGWYFDKLVGREPKE